MAVRFLPPPDDSRARPAPDRENLAEVIELRGRLESAVQRDRVSAADPAAELTAELTAELNVELTAEGVRTAMDDAVRMLARRARSSGELRRELLVLGHDQVEVEAVLLECESRLYLDDLGLARVLAETLRARKRASCSQIRLKLRERLLPDGVIEEVLDDFDDDEEHEMLCEVATVRARKMGGLDRQTAERRLLGFLARRGWSGERAVRVAREALDREAQRKHSPLASAGRSTVRFR